jgi:hypothetical protein
MEAGARPRVFLRALDHSGTHGIQLHIATCGQEMAFIGRSRSGPFFQLLRLPVRSGFSSPLRGKTTCREDRRIVVGDILDKHRKQVQILNDQPALLLTSRLRFPPSIFVEVTNRPVCAAKERDRFISGAATPPWKGGECPSGRLFVQKPHGSVPDVDDCGLSSMTNPAALVIFRTL